MASVQPPQTPLRPARPLLRPAEPTAQPTAADARADAEPRPQLRARRSPKLIALGVLAICVGGLGTAFAYQQATASNSIVIVANAVARGETITAGDLGVTTMGAAPGVATLPSSELAGLVGQQALVDLPKGAVVGPGAVGVSELPAGQAQLGLKLAAGRLPTTDLPAGTPITLVSVPADRTGGSPVDEAAREFPAVVVASPMILPDGATWTLDVAVPQQDAAAVAALSATDRLVVVRQAAR